MKLDAVGNLKKFFPRCQASQMWPPISFSPLLRIDRILTGVVRFNKVVHHASEVDDSALGGALALVFGVRLHQLVKRHFDCLELVGEGNFLLSRSNHFGWRSETRELGHEVVHSLLRPVIHSTHWST